MSDTSKVLHHSKINSKPLTGTALHRLARPPSPFSLASPLCASHAKLTAARLLHVFLTLLYLESSPFPIKTPPSLSQMLCSNPEDS